VIFLLLLACNSTEDTSASDTDSVATSDTAPAPQPVLESPALAEDLDPDPSVLRVELTASRHEWPAGPQLVDGYAYNGQVPGPTLKLSVGDTLEVVLHNDLDMPTTIHWHGIEVPYAMDGAGWQVQPVEPGASFTYTFQVNVPGTYWYHPHFNTSHQVDRGLYGALIVEDPADPPVDQELVVVLDSVGEVEIQDEQHEHVEPTPTSWLLNGMEHPIWEPPSGSTSRVRFINVSNAGYVDLQDVLVIGEDRGLGAHTDRAILAPGDRAEVGMAHDSAASTLVTHPYSLAGEGIWPPLPLFDIAPTGSAAAPSTPWVSIEESPTPDPGTTDLRYTFTGSAYAGWEINGQTWPEIQPDEWPLGFTGVLEIRNPSPSHHPFHLHGLVFEVLSVNGVAPQFKTVADTWDIGIHDVVRLLIHADNPGDWMSHCHILPHAHNGMMTVLSVKAP